MTSSEDELGEKLDELREKIGKHPRFKREGDEDDGEGGGAHDRVPRKPKPKDSSGGAALLIEDDERESNL